MRKLIVAEFISLDGVIQAPGGPEEDPSGGFRLGGWQAPYTDEAIGRAAREMFSQPFELLLGRRTYDIWAGYWPRIAPSHPTTRLRAPSTACASTWPRIDPIRLPGRTVMRSRATSPTRYARSSTRTGRTC